MTPMMPTNTLMNLQGGPQKSKPPPIFQQIVLKLPTRLDFFVKLKYESSTINPLVINIPCMTSLTMPGPQSIDMRHMQ